MAIPPFKADGYLPEGVHLATMEEVSNRFGKSSTQRRRLMIRLRRWEYLGRMVGAKRLLIDGSFVTTKSNPADVDVVIQLTLVAYSMCAQQDEDALELFDVMWKRDPAELFGADDNREWNEWIEFFSRTSTPGGARKGMFEVAL